VFPYKGCASVAQPAWPPVAAALALMGLRADHTGPFVTVSGRGHPLAGRFLSGGHVVAVLMTVAARLLTRQARARLVAGAWTAADDAGRAAIVQWATGWDHAHPEGPFDNRTRRRLKAWVGVADLPADWLARLPGLVKADFPFRPFSPVLVAALALAEHRILDCALARTDVVARPAKRL
jgi:hypothetical protein